MTNILLMQQQDQRTPTKYKSRAESFCYFGIREMRYCRILVENCSAGYPPIVLLLRVGVMLLASGGLRRLENICAVYSDSQKRLHNETHNNRVWSGVSWYTDALSNIFEDLEVIEENAREKCITLLGCQTAPRIFLLQTKKMSLKRPPFISRKVQCCCMWHKLHLR